MDSWGSRGVEVCALIRVLLLSLLASSLFSGRDRHITQGSDVRKRTVLPTRASNSVLSGCAGHRRTRITGTSSQILVLGQLLHEKTGMRRLGGNEGRMLDASGC